MAIIRSLSDILENSLYLFYYSSNTKISKLNLLAHLQIHIVSFDFVSTFASTCASTFNFVSTFTVSFIMFISIVFTLIYWQNTGAKSTFRTHLADHQINTLLSIICTFITLFFGLILLCKNVNKLCDDCIIVALRWSMLEAVRQEYVLRYNSQNKWQSKDEI